MQWDNAGMQAIPLPEHPTTLAEWLAHCERLHPKAIDMGLDRVQQVAHRMGLAMTCPVITVAGTNGKGSTCAFMRRAIEAAGLSTHVYSSPHLVRFNERIRVAGKLIDDDLLADRQDSGRRRPSDADPQFGARGIGRLHCRWRRGRSDRR